MSFTLATVQSGALGQFFPVSLSYTRKKITYLLLQNDDGEYQITVISPDNGTIDIEKFIKGKFGSFYDFLQVAYDETGSASYLCGINISGKTLEIFSIDDEGELTFEHAQDYIVEDRKSLTFYVVGQILHYFRQDEDSSTGKFTVKAFK